MQQLQSILRSPYSRAIAFLASFLAAVSPAVAQTAEWTGVCVGGAKNDVATIQGLECLIGNAFVVIISIIGLAAFAMFVVASLNWLFSGGNSKNVEQARSTMTYAIVGIVVALSAFIIINLISNFTGIDTITTFKIPRSSEGL